MSIYINLTYVFHIFWGGGGGVTWGGAVMMRSILLMVLRMLIWITLAYGSNGVDDNDVDGNAMTLKAEDSIQIPADTISGLYCWLYWKMTTIMMK